jgi:hypothetical protein
MSPHETQAGCLRSSSYDGNKSAKSTMTAMYNDKIEEAIADRDTYNQGAG